MPFPSTSTNSLETLLRLLIAVLSLWVLPTFGQTSCPSQFPAGTVFNVTQPFHFFFDQLNTLTPGVDHYTITVTPTSPAGPAITYNVGIPPNTASVNPGCTSYSVLADSTLKVGNYTYSGASCPTTATAGCLASPSVVFVINVPPPPTLVSPMNLQAK